MSSNEKITNYFDKTASKRSTWMRRRWYYYNLLIRQLKYLIPEGSRVLDIACGTGNLLAALKPSKGVGVDISSECVKIAQERFPNLKFLQGDAHNIKIKETFDYIILVNAVGYFSDIQKVLENFKTNCDQNTRIIILHYNFLWYPMLKAGETLGLKMREPIQNWVSPNDVTNFISLAGYDLIKTGSKIIMPVWLPLVSNMFNKYIANLPGMHLFNLAQFYIARLAAPLKPDERTCSIIIPARNEMGNIEAAVKRTPELGRHTEIIFVEGNSTDDTWKEIQRVAKKYGKQRTIRIAKQPGKGKGDAVRKGFDIAKNNILFILDADLTVEPEEMTKFYQLIASGKGEFINGSRLVYPMEEKAMRPINLFGNKMFSLIFTYLLGQRFKDTLCGTKVLTKKNYQKIAANRSYFGDFDPFGDFDLIFGAAKQSMKIVELPIRYKQRTYGETNIQRWKHGWLLLRMCFFAMRKIKFI